MRCINAFRAYHVCDSVTHWFDGDLPLGLIRTFGVLRLALVGSHVRHGSAGKY